MARRLLLCALALSLLFRAPGPVRAAGPPAVFDDAAAPMATEYGRYGGPAALGPPVSPRYDCGGLVCQAFQRLILQWRPDLGHAVPVNVFDELSRRGLDGWLQAAKQVPPPFDWSADAGRPWPEVVRAHQALLDGAPPIRDIYFSAPDPVLFFGLPQSAADYPAVYVVRAQRAVFQLWKADVPWARAGQVTVANGGEIAVEAGLVPAPDAGLEEARAVFEAVNARLGGRLIWDEGLYRQALAYARRALQTGTVDAGRLGMPAAALAITAYGLELNGWLYPARRWLEGFGALGLPQYRRAAVAVAAGGPFLAEGFDLRPDPEGCFDRVAVMMLTP